MKKDPFKKKIEKMKKSFQAYAQENGFRLNPDKKIVFLILKGLLEREKKFGARYCPCRKISGNLKEDKEKICPCKWHREEIKKYGHCLCGLFVK